MRYQITSVSLCNVFDKLNWNLTSLLPATDKAEGTDIVFNSVAIIEMTGKAYYEWMSNE